MAKKPSKVDQLPPDILEKLQELLRDPRVTQMDVTKEINEILAARGEEPISKSGVNRYAVRMDQVGAKLRQSREMAEMWIGKLGAAPQGKIGNLVNEILRTLSFDLALAAQEGELDPDKLPEVAQMLKDLALAQMRLEKAASENVKREEEIRKKVLQEAADLAAKAGKKEGLSADTIKQIRNEVMGMS